VDFFLGKTSIRHKTEINKHVIEHVTHFKYLGCDISYEFYDTEK
jgi:hypothetical protein